MKSVLCKIGPVIALIFMLIGTNFLPDIGGVIGEEIELNSVKLADLNVENIDTNNVDYETEYWAVVVSTRNSTEIYDSLVNTSNWDETHIRLLHLENATKDQILLSLEWLQEKSDSNDIVLFSDSSHGTHLRGEYGIIPWNGGIVSGLKNIVNIWAYNLIIIKEVNVWRK